MVSSVTIQCQSPDLDSMMFGYHVSICLVIGLCNLKFLKSLLVFNRNLGKGLLHTALHIYLKSHVFKDFCQAFHHLISNNPLVNENVFIFPSF